MAINTAVSGKFSDLLVELGGVPSDRVRLQPTPGRATIEDLLQVNRNGGLCELVDGTLVEKAMGWRESLIALFLGELIGGFVRRHNLGVVSGPDGFVDLLNSLVRGPDVAFVSWSRLPGGQIPDEAIPQVVPDLAVEVLSLSNTLPEMSRKRREYFLAGVRLVWMVDLRQRTIAVYTNVDDYQIFGVDQRLTGGNVLPGLEIQLAELFHVLDRRAPSSGE